MEKTAKGELEANLALLESTEWTDWRETQDYRELQADQLIRATRVWQENPEHLGSLAFLAGTVSTA